jgi:hypothetical protein
MGKSIRSKAQKQWRAQRREKLSDWERQRTQELHDRLIADVLSCFLGDIHDLRWLHKTLPCVKPEKHVPRLWL